MRYTFKRRNYSGYLTKDAYYGTRTSGKPSICMDGLRCLFRLPEEAETFDVVVSRKPHPDSYQLLGTENMGYFTVAEIELSNGRISCPMITSFLQEMVERIKPPFYFRVEIDA